MALTTVRRWRKQVEQPKSNPALVRHMELELGIREVDEQDIREEFMRVQSQIRFVDHSMWDHDALRKQLIERLTPAELSHEPGSVFAINA